jgi:hypothetical protein
MVFTPFTIIMDALAIFLNALAIFLNAQAVLSMPRVPSMIQISYAD